MSLEERHHRSVRAKRRFRAIVRLVIANRPWLEEVIDEELGENVKRNVQLLTKKKENKSLLTIQHKAIMKKPAEHRTESEKLLLYKIIGGLSCFRKYPEHVKVKLASVTYFYYFGPGRVIVKQNQEAYALYFIVTGEVTVSITSFDPVLNENVTINVGTMVAGNMFGEVSLLHDIPRTATITTATPCELLCLQRADFDTILKSSIQAQWDDIKQHMKMFSYFDGWDEVAVRECCILAKKRVYTENETILGDGDGADNHVHFVIKGKCRVIEHLLLSTNYVNGKKKYDLYKPSVDETDEMWKKIDEGPKTVSERQVIINPSADKVENIEEHESLEILGYLSEPPLKFLPVNQRSFLSRMDSNIQQNSTPAEKKHEKPVPEYKPRKKKPVTALSSICLPRHVETHFMQVCTFSETACFNLGEKMKRRRIVAISEVECMLIPKYWIWQRNKGNIWTRIQQFLDSRIPTTEAVFAEFLLARKWRAYKKDLLNSILKGPTMNIINNVPYSIRIQDDIEFADESQMY